MLIEFKNILVYIQQQKDLILQDIKDFARIYINNIIITNRTLEDHIIHIDCIFNRFVEYNITIKNSKCFINYPSTIVLNQRINIYNLSTIKNRFAALSKIAFPKNTQDLKHFLSITGYFRYYYKDYANVIEHLQKRKIQLLKGRFYKSRAKFNFIVKSSFK